MRAAVSMSRAFRISYRSGTNPRWIQHALLVSTSFVAMLTVPPIVLLPVFFSPSGRVFSSARATSAESYSSSPFVVRFPNVSLNHIGTYPPSAKCVSTACKVPAPRDLVARHAE